MARTFGDSSNIIRLAKRIDSAPQVRHAGRPHLVYYVNSPTYRKAQRSQTPPATQNRPLHLAATQLTLWKKARPKISNHKSLVLNRKREEAGRARRVACLRAFDSTTSSRLVGSDPRACRQFWEAEGLTGNWTTTEKIGGQWPTMDIWIAGAYLNCEG